LFQYRNIKYKHFIRDVIELKEGKINAKKISSSKKYYCTEICSYSNPSDNSFNSL